MSSPLKLDTSESSEHLLELLRDVDGMDAWDDRLFELAAYAEALEEDSISLYRQSRWAEGRKFGERAVSIFQKLYIANPDVYRADLARSLNSLAIYLDALKRHSEARDTILEALEHRRILFATNSDVYRADLAQSLNSLAIYLDALKRHTEARDTILEALEHRRILFAANPDVYRADLAQSLYNLAVYLNALKRHSEARDTTLEALEHFQILFAANPDVYRADLAQSLGNLAVYLDALKLHSEASHAEREALFYLNRTSDVVLPPNSHIGSGSFGVVHRAQWSSSAAAVWWHDKHYEQLVVKMLKGVSADLLNVTSTSNSYSKRLFRELVVSSRVEQSHHPNLVPYLGYITHNNGVGLLLPLFPGGNVLQYIENIPGADRRKLCRDIAYGIHGLHTLWDPIAHGDLKPENVVIDTEGRAALCDFGLAHILSAVPNEELGFPSIEQPKFPRAIQYRHTGLTDSQFKGTPRYFAPELMEADDVHPTLPADIWAFACTVAYILSGVMPFSQFPDLGWKGNAQVTDALVASVPPYEIDSITKDYPEFAILAECWNPEPSKRLTIGEIIEWMGW